MNKKIFMSASFLAILAAYPAYAETAKGASSESLPSTIERKAEKAGDSIGKAADDAGDAVNDAYKDMKAYFTDENDVKAVTNVNVLNHLTAKDLIGKTVQDPQGKDIGKIHDIIIDKDGDAESVVIENGGIMGIGGTLAVFDYDVIKGFTSQKDVVVKLSEPAIKTAREFAYKTSDISDKNAIILPQDRYSISKMIGADVIDPAGKKLASVETVAFDGDDADYVIVMFGDVMGLGGKKAALDLDALQIAKDGNGGYKFKLNAQQTAQFESYKQSTKAN